MRLIDTDIDVSKYITTWKCDCSEYGKQYVMAIDDLRYLPTVDLPVRHGKWVHDGQRYEGGVDWYHCSVCN